jgi:glycosyltransferase involved in cell wall biosynthesis
MRVVYVSTVPYGGTVSHLLTLAPRAAEEGVDVHVLCFNDEVAEDFRSRGVPATVVPVRHKLDLIGAARLWPHLEDADVVHTHDRRAGLLARPQGRLRGAHVVHTLHGLPEEIATWVGRRTAPPLPGVSGARLLWLRRGYLPLESFLSSMGTVITPSEALRRFLVGVGFEPQRVRVIPSAVEVRRTEPPPAHTPPTLGVIANLEYWKGIDVLLDACARVTGPVRLEVIGDGEQRARLEARSRALGLDATFHGRVEGAAARLDNVDVFVLPSRAENLPLVVLEAMATALPVVATRVGGVPELIEDGRTGILVEPEDPAGLARAIESLSGDPARREAMGRAGAEVVARRFDPRTIARRLADLYAEVGARSARRRPRRLRFVSGSGRR